MVPFLYPEMKWDFRCENVVSINASGHKCAPCLNWLCGAKRRRALPCSVAQPSVLSIGCSLMATILAGKVEHAVTCSTRCRSVVDTPAATMMLTTHTWKKQATG